MTTMTDTQLLNKLEAAFKSRYLKLGLAIRPYTLSQNGHERLSFYDLGSEDGEDADRLGAELCDAPTLRELIEKLDKP